MENLLKKYSDALKAAKIAQMTGDASAAAKQELADALLIQYKDSLKKAEPENVVGKTADVVIVDDVVKVDTVKEKKARKPRKPKNA